MFQTDTLFSLWLQLPLWLYSAKQLYHLSATAFSLSFAFVWSLDNPWACWWAGVTALHSLSICELGWCSRCPAPKQCMVSQLVATEATARAPGLSNGQQLWSGSPPAQALSPGHAHAWGRETNTYCMQVQVEQPWDHSWIAQGSQDRELGGRLRLSSNRLFLLLIAKEDIWTMASI